MGTTKLAPVSLAMFYGASRDFANAFSVRVTLKNPIEPEPLRRALDRAMERYPYFAVRLAVQGGALVLEDNPLPVTIVKGPEPARLNTAASNYHLVGVSYERTSVIFGAFHALTDGAGAFPWIKTVLYYYLCETEGRTLDPAGVRLAGEEIPEGELEDPFQTEIPELEEPVAPKWSGAFRIADHAPVGKQRCWHIRIGETSFMKYTRTQDGSPATITSAFMAKALHTLCPDMTEPSVHCSVTTEGSGICIEINTCNGYFDYCFMQEFEDDKYVNAFVDLLESEGIYCTVSGPYDVHVPKMRLPDETEE